MTTVKVRRNLEFKASKRNRQQLKLSLNLYHRRPLRKFHPKALEKLMTRSLEERPKRSRLDLQISTCWMNAKTMKTTMSNFSELQIVRKLIK